ncbi:nucleoside triphosphate pyrophosphohydrolase [Alkalihalophilus pseudofirmus]|uniref:Nucleoside triphosphate pyrophosphohydrolase n=1 Tax=Alkalihalophilus pseudofirmus TaxID=79885 RepID=A0AAJ2NRW9_ALKPS|nr:nucleoside triphosphate pyrophosphohydrolase [Alkalihalophilus pseudofirmus]MDV2887304.1 nucleoside triphosphate pyrophosphohydrolase [Alkalihalophilus pseudofirmus]OLS34546.1 nucleoside triphosphate pyrophosphohydrolase [Alkalihalophilus pseudofirmus]
MSTINIIGLGAGDLEQMPLGVYRHLKQAEVLYVRTEDHPVLGELRHEGVTFQSFDHVYEQFDQFEDVYRSITAQLIEAASEGSITYAVPGHPFVAERTIQLLLDETKDKEIHLEFLGGQSFLDPMYNALKIDPIEGCQIVDGTALNRDELELTHHIIIVQVYDAMIASDVKLTLMERLPDDYEVVIATAVGSAKEQLTKVPLYELDHATTLNNLTAVYVPPVKDGALLAAEFTRLREVIAALRGPDGCPWDKKQTHQSLKKYLIEEAYEVLEAIDEEDDDHLIEELGDVLLQVMLHAQIGEDEGWFSIGDIIESTTEKMIRRHPHVFGNERAEDAEAVLANWEEIKKAEKGNKEESMLDGIPKGLPSLMTADQLQKKAARVGFDWDDVQPMWDKLTEELAEFREEVGAGDKENMEKELGDILFVIVNIARFYKINSEEALRLTNQKFKNRFTYIEQQVKNTNKEMTDCTLEELDQLWDESKSTYK